MVKKRTLPDNGNTEVPFPSQQDMRVHSHKNTDSNLKNEDVQPFDVETEFKKLYDKALSLGLTQKDFAKMEILQLISWEGSTLNVILKYSLFAALIIVVLLNLIFWALLLEWPLERETVFRAWFTMYGAELEHEECLVDLPESLTDLLRPPVECGFCQNVSQVDVVTGISKEEFEQLYAYTGVPVIVADGTANWTAPQVFSFEFFKEIYKKGSTALENHSKNCQFFPYKTAFRGLAEVMQMSEERARMEDGSAPWYVGWSNCDFAAANLLRKHYERPYFLPRLSESSKTDWIFMGSPGYGAHLHIDNVGHPSWQAQITGTKRWTLEPPPECYFQCPLSVQVTVQPGQIIVLDTNIWYHSTLNVGDDISITIGSEYD